MDKLISYFGSRVKAAEAIGVSPSYLSMVRKGKRQFSPELAKAIDSMTKGEVSKRDLRPDIFND